MGVFRMPSLGSDMEGGTLVEWLVGRGDSVDRGDVIAVVETQKGAIEIEIFEAGRVARLIADVGDTVPVGAPMAEIDGGGDPAASDRPAPGEGPPAPPAASAPAAARPSPPPAARSSSPAATVGAGVVPASPAARRAAEAAGLDLAAIAGSGPGGAVRLADVEAAGPAPTTRPDASGRRFGPAAMREAIGAAMARSKREAPHFYLLHRIDLTPTADRLAEANAERPPETRLALGLLLVRAAARAARDVPGLNGVWEGDAFRPSEAVHAGLAVSLRGGGLVAPALRDAADASLDDLMAAMRDLVARARSGRLRASELTAPTITVSSLGERGVDALVGVIFPPQAALVGFGTPARRPWVVGEEVRPRLVVEASLSADHRVADGRLGARFLAAVEDRLTHPEAP